MHYIALATDYDGTIAHDGCVDEATIAALEKMRPGGRRLILVTGRELPDLQRVMPRLDLFDTVVAENGALLYWPETREERSLAAAPDERFVARLEELGVAPLSVGRVIVATWEPNEAKVLQAVRELGLELNIIFNKGAVMVLPAGVNKASGLQAALDALGLSALNCVAVGDAENDMAFLEIAGASVAVANAVPMLKERAAWVTEGDRGRGVAELVERLLKTDLAELGPKLERQTVALGEREDGLPFLVAPHRETMLVTGMSGGGKSTFTQGLTERLGQKSIQFCILDPEGDYEGLEDAVGIGRPDRPPHLQEITDLLRKAETDVVVNLLGVRLEDRPQFVAQVLPELTSLRAVLGRPHVVIVDEAHHMLPSQWDPGAVALPQGMEGFLFISTQPEAVSPRLLKTVTRLLIVGKNPDVALGTFCQARGLCDFEAPAEVELGKVLAIDVAAERMESLKVIPGQGHRMRHKRKYAEGELGNDKSFWFRGPAGKLQLRGSEPDHVPTDGRRRGCGYVAVSSRPARLFTVVRHLDQGCGTGRGSWGDRDRKCPCR